MRDVGGSNSARLPARYIAVLCDILEGLGIERRPLRGAARVRSIDAPDAFVKSAAKSAHETTTLADLEK